MRGLDPRIHVFGTTSKKDVDCRVKPGNDGGKTRGHTPAAPMRPGSRHNIRLSNKEAQGKPGVRCTRGLVCKM